MNSHRDIFVGRKAELARWDEILRDPGGSVAVVIAPPGMGKTALLDKIMQLADAHTDLRCGAVRYEVTESDTPDVVMNLMMENAFASSNAHESSFAPTERRAKQWKALLKVAGLEGVGELVESLRHDPARPIRDQFIARLHMVSDRLPENGRVVFVLDPEKYMAPGSADGWRLVFRDLPDKVKFVIAQRPEDELAKSHPNGEFWRLPCVRLLTDSALMTELQPKDVDEYADAVEGTGQTPGGLRELLQRYQGHPYAMDAAVRLLQDSKVRAEDLPSHPDPTAFAAQQWDVVCTEHGPDGVKLVEVLAVLEVAAPVEIVGEVAGLDSPSMKSVLARPFIRGLVREETEGLRLYHALFLDRMRAILDGAPNDREAYHRRAIETLRSRLKNEKPDIFAAERLWRHVEELEGAEAGIVCFINDCTPALLQRGRLAVAEADSRALLDALPAPRRGTEWESALLGNLGNVLRIRGDLDGAEEMYRKSLEIEEKLGRPEGMANNYGSLGIVLQIRGDLDGAEEMHRKALEINQKLGRPEGMASDYGNLGIVLRIRGDLDGAEEMYRKSLEIEEKLGRPEGMANQYGNLGNVLRIRGDLGGARSLWQKSRDLFKQLGAQHMAEEVQGWIDQLPPED